MSTSETFGIDLGSQRCVIAKNSGEIVLNELGGMTTATLISFKGRERLVGESAVLSMSTNPNNTVDFLTTRIGKTFDEINTLIQDYPCKRAKYIQSEDGEPLVQVEYMGKNSKFSVNQLSAMLLSKLASCAEKYQTDKDSANYILAIPSSWGPKERQSLRHASKIAGLNMSGFVSRVEALAKCYHRKHPMSQPEEGEAQPKYIVIVDMGHTTVSAGIVKFTPEGEEVLVESSHGNLGSNNFDLHLFNHFVQQLKSKDANFEITTKKAMRLMAGCEKLKKLLSTVPEAVVQVENLGNDCDVSISIKKSEFEELCSKDSSDLKALLEQLLVESNIINHNISSVEIVGGGTRIPFVQDILEKVFESPIGRMLDSTNAVALGASYTEFVSIEKPKLESNPPPAPMDITENNDNQEDVQKNEDEDKTDVEMEDSTTKSLDKTAEEDESIAPLPSQDVLQRQIEQENEMREMDKEVAALANCLNELESFIYDMRNKRNGKHGNLINGEKLNPLLEASEDWMYSEEAENANLEVLQNKLKSLKDETRSICSEYYEKLDEEQKLLEKTLEEEAKKAAAEKEANGEEDDHDFRKLKKPERMRLVMKNKDEGTELFKGGNYKHAAARYVKALTHATKFFDLSPEDKEEVNKIKLSLYLNLAQCYLKLENWYKAALQCKDALDVDPNSTKALYRRALANEKQRKFEDAEKDIKEALRLAPNDSAIQKLNERIKAQIKKQLDKEKKMWSKAFN